MTRDPEKLLRFDAGNMHSRLHVRTPAGRGGEPINDIGVLGVIRDCGSEMIV